MHGVQISQKMRVAIVYNRIFNLIYIILSLSYDKIGCLFLIRKLFNMNYYARLEITIYFHWRITFESGACAN